MIDSSFQMPKQEVKTFEPLPAKVYQCQLTDIELRDGTNFQGMPEKQAAFTFTVIKEGEHYGRKLWAQASLKMVGGTKPSNLYKILSSLTGKPYSKEECGNADEWLNSEFLNQLVGTQKLLAVSQKPKQNGGMKNVIDSILPVDEDLPSFDPEKMKALA